MRRKYLPIAALSVFILFVIAAAGADAELRIIRSHSQDKAALIRELVSLTRTRENAEAIIDSKVELMESRYQLALTASIAKSETVKEDDREKISVAQAYYFKRFKKLFKERVKYGEIIERAEFEAYDRNFTAEEIKTMIEFYRTPAGRKMIRLTPKLVEETINRVDSEITPIVKNIVEEIIAELRRKQMM